MNHSFSRIVRRLSALGALFLLFGIAMPATCQNSGLAHFVAPNYPPLARNIMISGQVTLLLHITPDGQVAKIREEHATHALFGQTAQDVIRKWRFHHFHRAHDVTVAFYFSFSGETKRDNPSTVISADFDSHMIRVFVTTDGVPAHLPVTKQEQ